VFLVFLLLLGTKDIKVTDLDAAKQQEENKRENASGRKEAFAL